MKELIKKMDDGLLLLEVSKAVYDVEAIISASYKFTDRCHIHNDPISDSVVGVYFKAKDANTSLEQIANEFCNELIDQQLRMNVEKEFGNIRNEIVKKAFSPITK